MFLSSQVTSFRTLGAIENPVDREDVSGHGVNFAHFAAFGAFAVNFADNIDDC